MCSVINVNIIQVVVGTHTLLSPNVSFAHLGLLVIDEEQRFGVYHKEKLKSVSASTDVLTMSATPIPRTLQAIFYLNIIFFQLYWR